MWWQQYKWRREEPGSMVLRAEKLEQLVCDYVWLKQHGSSNCVGENYTPAEEVNWKNVLSKRFLVTEHTLKNRNRVYIDDQKNQREREWVTLGFREEAKWRCWGMHECIFFSFLKCSVLGFSRFDFDQKWGRSSELCVELMLLEFRLYFSQM